MHIPRLVCMPVRVVELVVAVFLALYNLLVSSPSPSLSLTHSCIQHTLCSRARDTCSTGNSQECKFNISNINIKTPAHAPARSHNRGPRDAWYWSQDTRARRPESPDTDTPQEVKRSNRQEVRGPQKQARRRRNLLKLSARYLQVRRPARPASPSLAPPRALQTLHAYACRCGLLGARPARWEPASG